MNSKRSNQLLVKYPCGAIGFRPFHDGSAILLYRSHTGKITDPVDCFHCEPGYLKDPDGYKTMDWTEQALFLQRMSIAMVRAKAANHLVKVLDLLRRDKTIHEPERLIFRKPEPETTDSAGTT